MVGSASVCTASLIVFPWPSSRGYPGLAGGVLEADALIVELRGAAYARPSCREALTAKPIPSGRWTSSGPIRASPACQVSWFNHFPSGLQRRFDREPGVADPSASTLGIPGLHLDAGFAHDLVAEASERRGSPTWECLRHARPGSVPRPHPDRVVQLVPRVLLVASRTKQIRQRGVPPTRS